MKRELIRTTQFVRALRRILKRQREVESDVRETLELPEADAFNPQLKSHKLTGKLDGSWACSAGYDLRILFEFVQQQGAEAILLLTIGTHDEVY